MAESIPPTVRTSMTGETVLVCGAGLAGASAVRALLARGARVLLADRVESDAVAALVRSGVQFVGSPVTLPADVDLVVTSPGWRPDHPLLRAAISAGVEVIGEVEFAWRLRGPDAAPWLAVTGTNGKTTTARMLESILRASGARALAVGNVGVSIIDAVTAPEPYDVLSVELSSFQLHWSSTIAPAAGVMLNLAPDHLDWHGSMEAYAAAKARVWAGWLAIGNLDDPQVVALLASADTPTRVGFTLRDPQRGELGVRAGVLVDCAFDDGLELVPTADIRPGGAHNIANALAAAALARAHGLTAEDVAAGLRSFVPDPHRNQFVASVEGVDYVDDSKATNPHAALASLGSYDDVVWIAGGQLKDAPVDELVSAVASRLRGAVLLGADRLVIADALRRHAPDVRVIEVASTDDGVMTEVVHAAAGLARPGDTVLLAPAAASYDMFSGYAARGDAVRARGPAARPAMTAAEAGGAVARIRESLRARVLPRETGARFVDKPFASVQLLLLDRRGPARVRAAHGRVDHDRRVAQHRRWIDLVADGQGGRVRRARPAGLLAGAAVAASRVPPARLPDARDRLRRAARRARARCRRQRVRRAAVDRHRTVSVAALGVREGRAAACGVPTCSRANNSWGRCAGRDTCSCRSFRGSCSSCCW